MKHLSIGICIAIAFVCSGCDTLHQAVSTVGDLQLIQRAVSKAAGTEAVTVNLNNGQYLTIGLVNTPLKDLPSDQKKAKAFEIAAIGYRSYPQMSNLSEVRVAFVLQRSYVGIFHYTDTTDVFRFSKSELSQNNAP